MKALSHITKAVVITMFILCSFSVGSSEAVETLTFGAVGNNAQKEITMYTPLMKYLEQKLGVTTSILVYDNTDQLARAIVDKNVDFFMDSPFPAAKVSKLSGAEFILRHWKKGVSEYSGVIFSKAGSITSLNDLKGKLIAFEDPDSTSSYLLPLLLLKETGLSLAKKSSFRDKAAANEVGYVFSGDDENTLLWVSKGRVAAGGIKKQEVAGKSQFKILSESPMVPRAVVCVSPHMSPEMKQNLETSLVGMKDDADAQKALQAIKKTTQFDKFPQGAETVLNDMLKYLAILNY